jgi:hypothetical protein
VTVRMTRLVAVSMIGLLGFGPAALWCSPALAAGKPKAGAHAATATAGSATAPATAGSATAPALPGGTTPFSPGVPLSPPTVPTATPPIVAPTSTSSSAGGLSGTNAILIGIGAVIVLGGIAYFIWRDARRHAPVKAGHRTAAADGIGPSARGRTKPPVKSRKLSPAERRRRKRGRAR